MGVLTEEQLTQLESIKKLLTPEQYNALGDLFKGLFSSEMSSTVKESPTDNYLIYAFVIIAVVLIVSLIIIIKISSNSANKAITNSVTPYIDQLGKFQKSFERAQDSYEHMAKKFNALSEELVRYRAIRQGEEDMFRVMMVDFNNMEKRVYENITNLFEALREHEKNSFERQLASTRYNYEVKMFLLEIKMHCGIPYAKSFGEKLVSKGYLTAQELDAVLQEIIKE